MHCSCDISHAQSAALGAGGRGVAVARNREFSSVGFATVPTKGGHAVGEDVGLYSLLFTPDGVNDASCVA